MPLSAPIRPILRDPALLLAAALLALLGAQGASLFPYVSAIAIHVFGLSNAGYAAVMVAASVLSVSSSVWFGIIADQRASRKRLALVVSGFLTAGTGMVIAMPNAIGFVLAHAVLLPLSAALFGHVFALSRLATLSLPEAERLGVMTILRALYALPWVLVLPVWAWALHRGVSLRAVYPVCFVMALVILGLIWRFWPRDGATRWPDPPSGLSLRASLREIADPGVLARVIALGGINAPVILYLVILGLIFAEVPGRGEGATAIYAGTVAGLEVPLMLGLALVVGRIAAPKLILIGTVLYCIHLAGLPFLAPTPFVWALTLAGAAGGAIVLTQPMAYLQNLLGDRPGAGASLMALQKLAGDAVSALIFALGTALAGYGLVAVLGTLAGVGAAAALVAMDARRRY